MTHTARLSLVALALAVVGCGGSQVHAQVGTITSGPSITALNQAFDRSELVVTAGQATGVLFDNRDSVPHNIAIYAEAGEGQPLFQGEIFGGPASREYELPAFPAGTYLFRCDVHQDMKGTLVAKP